MSLILDALRKSEHQRQRQVGPGLAVVPESPVSQRPATWLLILGGLLALNILVLLALLLTGRDPEPEAVALPAAEPVAQPAVSAPPPAAAPVETRPEPRRSAPVALPARPPRSEVRPLTTEVAAPPPTATQPPAGSAAPAGAAPRAATSPGVSAEQATADARLPRFTDLVLRGELNVPHMHVDIHVFSTVAADRFVFINMRKYTEGQATQEGPRIERIARDGVVMEHQGTRFFLPRD
jgi:general secretion pathway protein B